MDNAKLLKEIGEMDIFAKFRKEIRGNGEFVGEDGQMVGKRNFGLRSKIQANISMANLYKTLRMTNIETNIQKILQRNITAKEKRREICIMKRDKSLKFMGRHDYLKEEREATEVAHIEYWTLHYKRLHWLFFLVFFLEIKKSEYYSCPGSAEGPLYRFPDETDLGDLERPENSARPEIFDESYERKVRGVLRRPCVG
jgi:hypothetical protein